MAGWKKPILISSADGVGTKIKIAFQTGRSLPQDKVHLVIINTADLPDPPALGQPQFDEREGWTTTAWSHGKLTYFLMAPGDRRAEGKYL